MTINLFIYKGSVRYTLVFCNWKCGFNPIFFNKFRFKIGILNLNLSFPILKYVYQNRPKCTKSNWLDRNGLHGLNWTGVDWNEQKWTLMVNQKLDYLQFVHSVIQIQKGCPNTRRSSMCKKVVQHRSTWMTSQHLEILKENLYHKAYNLDHVLLFWSISKILIYHCNFPLNS